MCVCVCVHSLRHPAPVQNLIVLSPRPHEELNTESDSIAGRHRHVVQKQQRGQGASSAPAARAGISSSSCPKMELRGAGAACAAPEPPSRWTSRAPILAHMPPAPSKASLGGEGNTDRPPAYCFSPLVAGRVSVCVCECDRDNILEVTFKVEGRGDGEKATELKLD